MRTLRTLTVSSILVLFILASATLCLPQQNSVPKFTLDTLDVMIKQVAAWQREALWAILLTVAVVVLGAVVAALNLSRTTWAKPVSVILGIVVSGVTAMNHYLLHAPQTLKIDAIKLQKEEKTLELEIQSLDPSMDDPSRKQLLTKINADTAALYDLRAKLLLDLEGSQQPGGQNATAAYFQNFEVFAQSSQPDWFSNPPKDQFYLYFVGEAKSKSLAEAEQLSETNARNVAAEKLAKGLGSSDLGKYQLYMAEHGEVAQTYFSYDRNAKMFYYYTLLKLSRDLAGKNAVEALTAQTSQERLWLPVRVIDSSGNPLKNLVVKLSVRGEKGSELLSLRTKTGWGGRIDCSESSERP